MILGDSRIEEQATAIPATSDALVARLLGIPGVPVSGGGRDHAEIIAIAGTVHQEHAPGLRAFVADCSAKERPLVIDLLGTNYLGGWIERRDDPEIWSLIAAELDRFYSAEAPHALVALEELYLDATKVSGDDRATVEEFVAGYNTNVLRALAAAHPDRYLFIPRPAGFDAGRFAFEDVLHPTGSAIEDLEPAAAQAFDAAAVAAIGQGNSACAVFSLPGFAIGVNSQTRIFMAQLAAVSPNQHPAVAAWLRAAAAPPYRLSLARTTDTCPAELEGTQPATGPGGRVPR